MTPDEFRQHLNRDPLLAWWIWRTYSRVFDPQLGLLDRITILAPHEQSKLLQDYCKMLKLPHSPAVMILDDEIYDMLMNPDEVAHCLIGGSAVGIRRSVFDRLSKNPDGRSRQDLADGYALAHEYGHAADYQLSRRQFINTSGRLAAATAVAIANGVSIYSLLTAGSTEQENTTEAPRKYGQMIRHKRDDFVEGAGGEKSHTDPLALLAALLASGVGAYGAYHIAGQKLTRHCEFAADDQATKLRPIRDMIIGLSQQLEEAAAKSDPTQLETKRAEVETLFTSRYSDHPPEDPELVKAIMLGDSFMASMSKSIVGGGYPTTQERIARLVPRLPDGQGR